MAADYDAGEVTERERTAASHQNALAEYNAQSTKNQLSQTLGNYDLSDQQNRALADVQLKQNSRAAAADRFGQNRKLQTSAQAIMGAAGNALNGSSTENLLNMLATRTDLDNAEVWESLTSNQNQVLNALQESLNQNVVSRNDAAINAEKGLRDIEADTAAQLNNINPNLWVAPGEGDANVGSAGTYDANRTAANLAQVSCYLMPDGAKRQASNLQQPNKVSGNDYYSQLLNSYNRR